MTDTELLDRLHREADERVALLTDDECEAALTGARGFLPSDAYARLGLPPCDEDCPSLEPLPLPLGLSRGDVCVHAYLANAMAKRVNAAHGW